MEQKIRLNNVRLSFPSLFKATAMEEDQTKKFKASFILDPDKSATEIKKLKAVIKLCIADEWKGKTPKALKICLQDGNEKEYDGYENMLFITASNTRRPHIVDRALSPIAEEDGKVYAGCYVNASISLWAQDNKWGKRINASLRAVQFCKDGEPFGEGSVVIEDEFDVLDEADLLGGNDEADLLGDMLG